MHPEIFSSAAGGLRIFDFPPEELEFLRTMMLFMDPPQHSHYRRLVGAVFTPKRAAQWRDSISDTARAILDEVSERGECDLVTGIAGKLPSYVIAELVGIPRADGVKLYDLSEIIETASARTSGPPRSAASSPTPPRCAPTSWPTLARTWPAAWCTSR